MAKRKMQKKALDLADHKRRLKGHGAKSGSSGTALMLLVLLAALVLLLLKRG